jgi:hypothetical protein
MTNPFAVLVSQAIYSFHKTNVTTTLPKIVLYTAVGTTIAAAMIYKSMKHFLLYKKHTNRNPHPPQLPFEDKYFKEYDEWVSNTTTTNTATATTEEHKKECLENMYYATVRETINEFYGDIIMCYDHKTFSFAYYARTANIPYKYLETISRKYMIETNAPREIHVDIRSEYQKAKDRTNTPPAATATATAKQEHESESTEVFVKLKSYNNASNLKIHTTTNEEKTHKFADSIIDKDNQSSSTKTSSSNHNKILREKSNRYSYRGQIKDFDEHHKTFLADRRSASSATTATPATTTTPTATTTTPATTATPVGYAEFKKQQMRKSAL